MIKLVDTKRVLKKKNQSYRKMYFLSLFYKYDAVGFSYTILVLNKFETVRWKKCFLAFSAKFQLYDKIRLPYLRIKKNLKRTQVSLQHLRQIKPLLLPLLMGLLDSTGRHLHARGREIIYIPALRKRWRCSRIYFGTALLQYAAIDLRLQRWWENTVLLSSRHLYFSQLKNKRANMPNICLHWELSQEKLIQYNSPSVNWSCNSDRTTISGLLHQYFYSDSEPQNLVSEPRLPHLYL